MAVTRFPNETELNTNVLVVDPAPFTSFNNFPFIHSTRLLRTLSSVTRFLISPDAVPRISSTIIFPRRTDTTKSMIVHVDVSFICLLDTDQRIYRIYEKIKDAFIFVLLLNTNIE